jgi:hypothetical protein
MHQGEVIGRHFTASSSPVQSVGIIPTPKREGGFPMIWLLGAILIVQVLSLIAQFMTMCDMAILRQEVAGRFDDELLDELPTKRVYPHWPVTG